MERREFSPGIPEVISNTLKDTETILVGTVDRETEREERAAVANEASLTARGRGLSV